MSAERTTDAPAAAARPGVDTGRLSTGLNDEAHAIVYDQYLSPTTWPTGSARSSASSVR